MLVIAISAIIGLWLLSSIINGIFLAPPKRPIIAPIAPKVVKPVEVPPETNREKLSDPEQVMKNCYKAVQDVVSIMPPGWVIGNISCTAGRFDDFMVTAGRADFVDEKRWTCPASRSPGRRFPTTETADCIGAAG